MKDATNLRLCSNVVFTMEKSAKWTWKVQTHGAQWSTVSAPGVVVYATVFQTYLFLMMKNELKYYETDM